MTVAEWLSCEEAIDMLRHVKQHRGMRKQAKQRRQRLYSAACCRRVLPLVGDSRCGQCIEVVERFADCLATRDELQAAKAEANAIWLAGAPTDTLFACLEACYESNDEMRVSTTTISAV